MLDSLNYNIFDVSTLPLHNSLQMHPEVPGNQREKALILSNRVENIGDIFSLRRNRCRSVCVSLVLYIAPEEIVQRLRSGFMAASSSPPFFEHKQFEMMSFLKCVSTKSKVRSAECAFKPHPVETKITKIFSLP